MIVATREIYRTKFIKHFDIDIEDYRDWLDGEKPTEDNLLEYIYELGLDPEVTWEDGSTCLDSYVDDMDEVFEKLNNE